MMKVQQELAAAIEKHGKAVPAETYESQFFDRIKQKKNEIAAQV